LKRIEVIIGGFGGQGTLLAGSILGRAAVFEGKKVVQTRSYGAEARGGAARSEVVISDEDIDYPMVMGADALIAMSQLALDRYIGRVKADGVVMIDEDLVKGIARKDVRVVKIPATKIASEELKLPIVANMIMMGALTALTGIVKRESLTKSIRISVPKGTKNINLKALRRGLELIESMNVQWR
jgi:2-oxoglutarate ferredoxin oxidoreductase subunit gamma